MSETVTYKGTLQLVASGKEASLEYADNYVKVNELTKHSYNENNLEFISEEKNFELINDNLYLVAIKTSLTGDDIFEAKHVGNNEYEFLLQYYNGGCSFSEALETALDKLQPRPVSG